MTIVINKTYGGFWLPEEFCEAYGLDELNDDVERTDPRLVDFVLSHDNKYEDYGLLLVAVEIPDEATDWEMDEYDGMEAIIYVLDGKIHHA